MSKGPAAFPTPGKTVFRSTPPPPSQGGVLHEHKIPSQDGMALRDYFAAKVVAALLSSKSQPSFEDVKNAAGLAYFTADQMLAERDKPTD